MGYFFGVPGTYFCFLNHVCGRKTALCLRESERHVSW